MPLARGTRLGPYEVLSPIGAGGMGEVYKAKTRAGVKLLDFGLAKVHRRNEETSRWNAVGRL